MYAEEIKLLNGRYFLDAYCPGFDYSDEVFRVQVNGSEYYIPMSSVAYIRVDKDKSLEQMKRYESKMDIFWKRMGKYEIHD